MYDHNQESYSNTLALFTSSIDKGSARLLMHARTLQTSYARLYKSRSSELDAFVSELEVRAEQEFWDAAKAREGKCFGCRWATGHKVLPCTVNPMEHTQGCSDYEVS
jgi:hypothetical protein